MRNTQRTVLALIALATAAGAAFSQTVVAERYGQAGGTDTAPFVSTRTRAEVQQEAADALAKGQIAFGPYTGPQTSAVASSRTRAEVIAETREAMRKGEIPVGPAVAAVQGHETTRVANQATSQTAM